MNSQRFSSSKTSSEKMSLFEEDSFCDRHCTSCRIWYLRLLRPGDTVPFQLSHKVLPIGLVQCGLGMLVIVLDILVIFCQTKNLAAPAPSLLGSPASPIWISLLFVLSGLFSISAFKKKERFMTAVGFAFSLISLLSSICLIAVCMMGIAQEADFFQTEKKAAGVIIGTLLLLAVVGQVVCTSSNALICYLALSSHDDRWFTDRGTQYELEESHSSQVPTAHVTVPSGQPAFLFYAPSSEAAKYSSALRDVLSNSISTFDDKEAPKRPGTTTKQRSETTDVGGQTPQHVTKHLPGNYLSPPVN